MEASPKPAAAAGGNSSSNQLKRYQLAVKRQVNSIRWEMGMLVFVIFYFIVVFLTFMFEDQKVLQPVPSVASLCAFSAPAAL